MKKIIKIGFMYLIMFLLAIAMCLAVKTISVQSSVGGLYIENPKSPYWEAGLGDVEFHFHVFNSSGYALIPPITNCTVHIYNSSGAHMVEIDAIVDGLDYEVILGSNITNHPGTYAYIVQCANSKEAGFTSDSFLISTADINPNNYLVLMLG
jgi:hypothetical protein